MALHYPDQHLFIDGTFRSGVNGTLDVLNPRTNLAIGVCSIAGQADLDDAVAAAMSGFSIWAKTPAHDRAVFLRRAADLLEERANVIAQLIHLEQGKSIAEAEAEVCYSAEVLRWNAGEAERIYGRIIPARRAGERLMVLPEPVGPILALTPWNFPIYQPVAKIAPALAAGCSVIVKPSEETPAGATALITALHDAGIPKGVINMVFGDPAMISTYLIASPAIRKISFTGSVPVGRIIAAQAGQHLKKATLELGGHAPVIICEDVAVEAVARLCAEQKFRNAGQVCVSASRFIVQHSIKDAFVKAFQAASESLLLGPLLNARRVDAMENLVADAVRSGAKLLTGGVRPNGAGNFYPATILLDPPPLSRIMQDEPFGPIASITGFDTLDEALEIANSLPYGLAAYGFTQAADTAEQLMTEVDAGMVLINTFGAMYPETPFGGVKDSGYGSENGKEGIQAYLSPKLAVLGAATVSG
ncbi:NAD-dependent succinate-semialdehyde dehydrogenase [Pseudorhodobacter sp. W20_MBD10_FR17]|uniref:NAD-dependent succinate-semialdehyde dehydrogenase n=1 Tax=Pseudorhodobacter sp. W20_MBD10_FR17 TaxID=3240266 RepID=UPI003F97EB7D